MRPFRVTGVFTLIVLAGLIAYIAGRMSSSTPLRWPLSAALKAAPTATPIPNQTGVHICLTSNYDSRHGVCRETNITVADLAQASLTFATGSGRNITHSTIEMSVLASNGTLPWRISLPHTTPHHMALLAAFLPAAETPLPKVAYELRIDADRKPVGMARFFYAGLPQPATPTPANVPTETPTPLPVAPIDREWQAAGQVLGSAADPKTVLYPAMNATGYNAIVAANLMGMTEAGFMDAQNHPAALMDGIQHWMRTMNRGLYGVEIVESANQQVGLLDFTGLTPAQQHDIITGIVSGPSASSYVVQSQMPSSLTSTPEPTATLAPQHCSRTNCIFPPGSTFNAPDTILGTGYAAFAPATKDFPGYTMRQDPTTTVVTFTWYIHHASIGPLGEAIYSVVVHTDDHFAAAATSTNDAEVASGQLGDGGCQCRIPALIIPYPVTSNEWVRGLSTQGGAIYGAGGSWRNIQFMLEVDSGGNFETRTWAWKALALLVGRTRRYAATHGGV